MKKLSKIFVSVLCSALIALPVLFTACEPGKEDPGNDETVDYVSQLSLDFSSNTKKQEVSVRLYIDGDTTHFDPVTNSVLTAYNAADFEETKGYIKARYLAVNTPESTGKIEKWGKTASNFTHDTLAKAQSIIVESDDSNWNIDSTGERYLLWIWYKPQGGTEYRNLNVELLQNGYALASSTANNRYGEIASAALAQAQRQQLHVYSPASTVDENYYEGSAHVISLKELRCNIADYAQESVVVEGVVTASFNNTVYVEDYDEETETYFGIQVYYGFPKDNILEVLVVGNRVRVVGSVTEFQGTYQISGVSYNKYRDLETNSKILSTDNELSFKETSASLLVSGKLSVPFEIEDDEGNSSIEYREMDYGAAVMNTSVTVSGLTVQSNSYTEDDGNIVLRCTAADGTAITVFTQPLKDENGNSLSHSDFVGKTITVKGIVDYHYGYQVACHRLDYITVVG